MLPESRWENSMHACKSFSDKMSWNVKEPSPLFKHLSGHYLQICDYCDDYLLVINHAHAVTSPAARS